LFAEYNDMFHCEVFGTLAGQDTSAPHLPVNHSTHRIEMAKGQGANKLLTQLPVMYLILIEGAGVDAGVERAHIVRDFKFL